MKKARFLISTLAAAGFGAVHPLQEAIASTTGLTSGGDDPNNGKVFKLFKQDHAYTLAGHRSHSSHSSHSSHRSSSGGSSSYPVYVPAPVYSPPPKPAPSTSTPSELERIFGTPTTRSTTPSEPQTVYGAPTTPVTAPSLSGRTELFNAIVRRVQTGLMAYGYYTGPIDGVVGTEMRGSLTKFQTDFSLKVTGTITPEVLDSLKVSTQ